MKLKIARFKNRFGLPGLVLTDEHGKMLPGQRDAVFSSPMDGAPEITVTFVVGKDISMDFDLDYEDVCDDPEGGRWEKPAETVIETRRGVGMLHRVSEALKTSSDGFTETVLGSLEKQRKEEPN